MPPDEESSSEPQPAQPASEQPPEIEDAYAVEGPVEETVPEDDPRLLDPSARSLETDTDQEGEFDRAAVTSAGLVSGRAASDDDTSDADAIVDEPDRSTAATGEGSSLPNWDHETSVRSIAVELKRVEEEVRALLEGRDSKRKRKLAGTRRWLELEEDILAWRFTGKVDEPTLDRLRQLITRRHHLFRRLRFMGSTRPTWNT